MRVKQLEGKICFPRHALNKKKFYYFMNVVRTKLGNCLNLLTSGP